jgi:hypothetical protein
VRGSALAQVAREARLDVHRLLANTDISSNSNEEVRRLKGELQEMTEAKMRVDAQRRELQVGARDLCDKVSVMSEKYRIVTAELELSQRQMQKLQAKYQKLKQGNN